VRGDRVLRERGRVLPHVGMLRATPGRDGLRTDHDGSWSNHRGRLRGPVAATVLDCNGPS
jgi:hypothetical protein